MSDPDHEWWNYGTYTGEDCPNCGRMRLMACEDNQGRERVVCEKCQWEPARGEYCGIVDAAEGQKVVDDFPESRRSRTVPNGTKLSD